MSSEKKENKTLYKHYLSCTKCSFKFSIEHEESNNTKIGLNKMKCPLCSKPIQLDPAMLNVSGKPSMENQSRMNAEASKEAMSQANKQKQIDRETGEGREIPVTSYQEGKGKGQTVMIPKKVIDSIKEKVEPELSE